MPGGDAVEPVFEGIAEHLAKFDMPVAGYAGVGRAPMAVFTDKIFDHVLTEGLLPVQHEVGDAEAFAYLPGVLLLAGYAAGAAGRILRPEPESDAGHIMPLLA